MKNVFGGILLLIAVGAAGFYAGTKYPRADVVSSGTTRGAGAINRGARGGSGFTSGEILSVDQGTLTLKLRDGGSKIVIFTDSTQVLKSVSGLKNDHAVGEQVTATGNSNPDGSITAQSVQIRPASSNPSGK